MFAHEQDSISGHKILFQSRPLAYRHRFFMINDGVQVDVHFVARFFHSFGPVHFFVVQKIIRVHQSGRVDSCFPDHHGGPVDVARFSAYAVVLAVVGLELADAAVATR